MCKATGSWIAKMGCDCETDAAGMKSGVRLAEVVIREAFTIWELSISLTGLNRGDLLKEFRRVGARDMIKQRD